MPLFFQIAVGLAAIVGTVGAALAFLLVIWPSIRNQERRAERIEQWLESEEGKAIVRALHQKLDVGGKTVDSVKSFAGKRDRKSVV